MHPTTDDPQPCSPHRLAPPVARQGGWDDRVEGERGRGVSAAGRQRSQWESDEEGVGRKGVPPRRGWAAMRWGGFRGMVAKWRGGVQYGMEMRHGGIRCMTETWHGGIRSVIETRHGWASVPTTSPLASPRPPPAWPAVSGSRPPTKEGWQRASERGNRG